MSDRTKVWSIRGGEQEEKLPYSSVPRQGLSRKGRRSSGAACKRGGDISYGDKPRGKAYSISTAALP